MPIDFNQAVALHEAGKTAEAIKAYRATIAAGGGAGGQYLAAAYSNLGSLLGQMGEREECERHSATAASLLPTHAPVVFNWGNALMGIDPPDNTGAATVFKKVLNLEPDHAAAYHNLALLAHKDGAKDSALEFFRAALACGPQQLAAVGGASQVYANMAAAGLGSASSDDALDAARAAVAAAPTNPTELVRLAERLLASTSGAATSASADAEAALRSALEHAPADDQALNLLATILQGQPGRWPEAVELYESAIRAAPTNGDVYHNLGTVHQRLGRAAAARAMYEHAMRLAPGVPNVYVSLASISPPPENSRLFRQAIALRPTDADIYARLAASLAPMPLGAASLPSEKSLRAAIAAIAHASKLAPADSSHHAEIGRMKLALASHLLADGAAAYATAAKLRPASAAAANAAALLEKTLGDPRAAAGRFEEVAQRVHAAIRAATGAGRTVGALLEGRPLWRRAARALVATGYVIIDGALGGSVAQMLSDDCRRLQPVMSAGRVGPSLDGGEVRTDRLWRHKRGESSMLDSEAAHMKALHALFDAVPLGLNAIHMPEPSPAPLETAAPSATPSSRCAHDGRGGGVGTCDELVADGGDDRHLGDAHGASVWSLISAEDLQFACYAPSSFYRRHSDAQNASRRVLTAIYYPNVDWAPADGGHLRLHGYAGIAAHTGWPVDIEPRADRLLLFDSSMDHEVLPVTATHHSRKPPKKGGRRTEAPPRCAVTQWFQDLAPPLVGSSLAFQRHEARREA